MILFLVIIMSLIDIKIKGFLQIPYKGNFFIPTNYFNFYNFSLLFFSIYFQTHAFFLFFFVFHFFAIFLRFSWFTFLVFPQAGEWHLTAPFFSLNRKAETGSKMVCQLRRHRSCFCLALTGVYICGLHL